MSREPSEAAILAASVAEDKHRREWSDYAVEASEKYHPTRIGAMLSAAYAVDFGRPSGGSTP